MALTKIPSNLITLDAIDGTLIADDAINSEHIANGAIDAAHMSANSIDSDSYVDGSIDNAHLADDAVGVAELSATGTASSSTYLRGDNSWAALTAASITSYTNSTNNRVLTSVDSTTVNSEANLTFDGSTLAVTGAITASGAITGNLTGNASGTALTVTQAAQSAITSLGTLTTLTVDDITINASTISDNGALTLSSGDDITLDAVGDIHLDADGADITFKDAGTIKMILKDEKLIIGHTASITGVSDMKLQVNATDSSGSLQLGRWTNNQFGSYLSFVKSRNATVGSNTVVQDGDSLGQITWSGDDGSDWGMRAAGIFARVDGTPGSDDMPGRIEFITTADGVGFDSTKIHMVIKSDGKIGIGTTSPSHKLHTYHSTNASDTLIFADNLQTSQAGADYNKYGIVGQTRGVHSSWSRGVGVVGLSDAATFHKAIGVYAGLNTTKISGFGYDSALYADGNSLGYAGTFMNGNVGIGTTSPSETLHVKRADGTALIVESSNDQNNTGDRINIEFRTDAAQGIAKIIGGKEGNYQGAGVRSGYLAFQTINANSYAERMRILSSGGITFNGDTAAANALDDYEEGTWTPALITTGGVTTSSITTYGIYTKIGNICHIHAKIDATLSSLPGQTFQISGLPFTSLDTSDSYQRAIITIGGDTLNLGGNAIGKAHFRTNGTSLQGVYLNSGSTAYWTYNTMDSSSFELNIHGHYTTT